MNPKVLHNIKTRASDAFAAAKVATIKDRLGIKPSPSPSVPVSAEAETERPYSERNSVATIPPVQIWQEIYSRAGIDPQGLVTDDLRDQLKKAQRKIEGLERELKEAFHNGNLLAARAAARKRLKAGKGTTADANFETQSWMAAKRALKAQIRLEKERAVESLVAVATAAQKVARRVLPHVEAEAQRLGIPPFQVPLVRSVALACWAPAVVAVGGTTPPKQFLRSLGIKL